MFDGIPIKVYETLANCNKALFMDGVLHISPAMHSLMVGATSAELEHFIANLPVLNLGKSFDFNEPMMVHTWD